MLFFLFNFPPLISTLLDIVKLCMIMTEPVRHLSQQVHKKGTTFRKKEEYVNPEAIFLVNVIIFDIAGLMTILQNPN